MRRLATSSEKAIGRPAHTESIVESGWSSRRDAKYNGAHTRRRMLFYRVALSRLSPGQSCTAPEWGGKTGGAFEVEKPGGFAMLAIASFIIHDREGLEQLALLHAIMHTISARAI